MQAIRTQYIGPTNTKPARMQATCEAKTIHVSYNHALDVDGNHKAACLKLVAAMKWDTNNYSDMVGGQFKNDHYWVFDDNRLKALRGIVNSIREASWSGNPWGKPEFKAAVKTIGFAYGFYADDWMQAPTTDTEIEKYLASKVK